jgi:hypothetical protein
MNVTGRAKAQTQIILYDTVSLPPVRIRYLPVRKAFTAKGLLFLKTFGRW